MVAEVFQFKQADAEDKTKNIEGGNLLASTKRDMANFAEKEEKRFVEMDEVSKLKATEANLKLKYHDADSWEEKLAEINPTLKLTAATKVKLEYAFDML